MDYWYLWVVFIVLCVVTAFVLKKASAALSLHNGDKKAFLEEIDRLKALKEKYSEPTAELIDSSEPSELLEGLTAVLQAKVEKAENPALVFKSFNEAQKNIYTLNYFVEDVRTSLSFFYKNNGEPLVSVAHKALSEVGCEELSRLAKTQFDMYDENNEDVSLSVEKMKKIDEDFAACYDEGKLLLKIKAYVKSNADSF